jgi:hypothetical protein
VRIARYRGRSHEHSAPVEELMTEVGKLRGGAGELHDMGLRAAAEADKSAATGSTPTAAGHTGAAGVVTH